MYGNIGTGITIGIDEKAGSFITVKLNQDGCRDCGLQCKTREIVFAYNRCNASLGQEVRLLEDESFIIKVLFIQFGTPLLGFVLGIIGGYYFSANELTAIVTGFIGLFALGFTSRLLIAIMNKTREPVFIADSITYSRFNLVKNDIKFIMIKTANK